MLLKQIPEDFIVEEIPNKDIIKYQNIKYQKLSSKKHSFKYVIFLLEKKNYDTEKVILKLSEIFKIPRKFFSYAGNKDRHAITRQYCTVKNNFKKIDNIDNKDFKINILGYSEKPISLGDLIGNKFIITIRDLNEQEIKKFLEIKVKKNFFNVDPKIYFVNYFDEQRFSKKNYLIGYYLIKKDFKKALSLIDYDSVKEHIYIYKNDYIGALKKIPIKILSLYINSVQSFLFNEVCCEYIKKKFKDILEISYNLTESIEKKFVFPKINEKNYKLLKKLDNDKYNEKNEINNKSKIPLISFDTDFSNYKKDFFVIYEKILKQEKISLNDFVIRQFPELSAFGNERNLFEKASNIIIKEPEKDDLNIGKYKIQISFTLNKGCYATLFVKYLYNLLIII